MNKTPEKSKSKPQTVDAKATTPKLKKIALADLDSLSGGAPSSGCTDWPTGGPACCENDWT